MPTQSAIRQRAMQIEPLLGRTVPLTAADATSLSSDTLKTGTVSAARYAELWMLRPSAATSVDRLRVCSTFDSATGKLEHAGPDYTDTTITNENLEIHEYEPYVIDDAMQSALRSTRFPYRTILPARSDGRYHLHDLTWITDPAHVINVGRRGVRVLTPNRHMEQWNGYSTAGSLVPDWLTLGGESGGVYARSTTQAFRGKHSLKVTRAGTDVTFKFTVDLGDTGVTADNIRSEKVTGVMVASGDAGSVAATITVDDGPSSTAGGTGITSSAARQEISVEHTISATATTLDVIGTVTVDGDVYVDEFYLVFGTLDDVIRRDTESVAWEAWDWFEQGQPLLMHSNPGRGTQIIVNSRRPYTELDSTRVLAGDADADITDAPLDLIAYGLLFRLFEQRSSAQSATANEVALFAKYRQAYGALQASHFYEAEQAGGVTEQIMNTRPMGRIARIR